MDLHEPGVHNEIDAHLSGTLTELPDMNVPGAFDPGQRLDQRERELTELLLATESRAAGSLLSGPLHITSHVPFTRELSIVPATVGHPAIYSLSLGGGERALHFLAELTEFSRPTLAPDADETALRRMDGITDFLRLHPDDLDARAVTGALDKLRFRSDDSVRGARWIHAAIGADGLHSLVSVEVSLEGPDSPLAVIDLAAPGNPLGDRRSLRLSSDSLRGRTGRESRERIAQLVLAGDTERLYSLFLR